MNHIQEFRDAIMASGLTAPDDIVDDGKLRRFASNGNPKDDSGWYFLHGDERPVGQFGCWKHGIEKITWTSKNSTPFTPEQKAEWKAKLRAGEAARAEAQRIEREQAAAKAADMWARATPVTEHAYLTSKQVGAHGIRELNGELLIPMRAGPGAYVGLQRIMPDGEKKFLKGTPATGAYHVIGKPERDGLVVIGEGYATLATIQAAIGACQVVAFNAGNLEAVARKIRAAMPSARIVIAADDDAWTEGNPGMAAAQRAADAVNGTVIAPVWAGHRAVKRTDFNDLAADEGIDAVRDVFHPRMGRDKADSVAAADAANNAASDEVGATPSPAAVAVDVPAPRSPVTAGGVPVSDVRGPIIPRVKVPERLDIFVYSTSPKDTAHEFQESLPDDSKVYYWRGDFYIWNGHRYAVRDQIEVHQMLYNFLDVCLTKKVNPRTGDPEVLPFKPKKSHVEDIMHALRAICFIDLPEPPSWISPQDGDPDAGDIMAFRNGFLHVPTRTMMESDPRLFITNALEFDYDPSALAPVEWLRFLAGIWPQDSQAVEAMADMFGYMLTADTSQQKMFMLIGPPRSGKGTILRILQSIVGVHNRSSPSLASLGGQFGLESLIGKRLGMISDARLSGRADQAPIVENLLRISGEDSVQVDRKHRDAWCGKLAVRFVMAANETPNFTDASGALPNRFIMFKMDRSNLGNEDMGLTARLLRELPGILLWALDGLDSLRARGYLMMPESGREIADEMRDQASPVAMFVGEMCIVQPGEEIDRGELYKSWVDWCKGNGMDHPGTSIGFARKLSASIQGIGRNQPLDGGRRLNLYTGIRLRHGHESPV